MAIESRGKQYYVRFQHKGEKIRSATGLAATKENMTAAKAMESQLRASLVLNESVTSKKVPFSIACAQFLTWCETVEYRAHRNTYLRLRASLASAAEFFDGRLVCDIDAGAIEDYKTHRASVHCVKDITIRHDLYALSLFFRRYALKRGLAKSNPLQDVKKPSAESAVRIHVLTREEESVYFDGAGKHKDLYDLARIMLLQGCRPEEVLVMRPSAVDSDRNIMKVGSKTEAGFRELEMTSETAVILGGRKKAALESGGQWLFPSPRREGHHLVKLNGTHDKVCLESGVSFVLYDLRHTFATRMLTEVGVDLATVAALLGHSGLRVVAKYLHPQAKSKSEAMKQYDQMLRARLKRVK